LVTVSADRALSNVGDLPICIGSHTDGRDRHLGTCENSPPTLVVDGDDRLSAVISTEEQELGREVRFFGSMKVEVIDAELGEAHDVERQSVYTSHGKCVTRDLHRDSADASLTHDGEQIM